MKGEAHKAPAETADAARLAASDATEEERAVDLSLRPRAFDEFVGQERIRKILGMSIAAARQRGLTPSSGVSNTISEAERKG